MSKTKTMTSPQWKSFQPPSPDPAILSFQRAPTLVNTLAPPTANSNGMRETGFVEKLLHSYGFIQCCERESRLFFHFSEYNGNAENMKIGDPVEFQMSFDRRTGKPVACTVIKVDQSLVSSEILSDERFHGTIVQEAKAAKNKNVRHTEVKGSVPGNQDSLGRVTYEHSGECFFLPYSLDDITDNNQTKVKPGDQVSFFIATDKRNGNIRARKLELARQPDQEKYQGVVCSMKESFGFIERADVVREIFFHYSEFSGDVNELILGDDVEFNVQTRHGKEVAVNISRLPEGTVLFEDISPDDVKGIITKTLRNLSNRRQSTCDPLGGRIVFENSKGSVEIPYGDKDHTDEYTLCQGDIVYFNIATDKRDKLQRATNIRINEKTFKQNGEKREMGSIASIKEAYGFIQCAEREARMFFHFSEVLDSSVEPKPQDEVEFTVTQDPSARLMAIRIRKLPKGSVSLVRIREEKHIGTIDREPGIKKMPGKHKESEHGKIIFDEDGSIHTISYSFEDLLDLKNPPKYGDKVDFNIAELRKNSSRTAVNIKVIIRNTAGKCQGFIATLKDNYGFIENADHDKEVFFHFSTFDGDPNDIDLGDEVEYTLAKKSSKMSAEGIHKLPKGTVAPEEILRDKGILQGKVIRPMRIINPEQDEYAGMVQVGVEDDPAAETYLYGITSLADKRDFLQKGDLVKFQVAAIKSSGKQRAVNIAAMRKYIRAKVDSVKGQFGFLHYEAAEGKKLFFHMTEVHDGVDLQPGNEVEFVVVQNQRNQKYSACSVRKITDLRRPERLISRLKSISDDLGAPRLLVIRQPKGPDGNRGFAQPRTPWLSTM